MSEMRIKKKVNVTLMRALDATPLAELFKYFFGTIFRDCFLIEHFNMCVHVPATCFSSVITTTLRNEKVEIRSNRSVEGQRHRMTSAPPKTAQASPSLILLPRESVEILGFVVIRTRFRTSVISGSDFSLNFLITKLNQV